MRRSSIMKFAAGGALITLAAVAGCRGDFGDPGGGVSGPGGGLEEGARVSGTVSGFVQLLGRDGAAFDRPLAAVPFEARISGGIATLDSALGVVAATRGLPVAERSFEFVDGDGHRNRLVLGAGEPGAPVNVMRQYRDGQLALEVSFDWERRTGGWLLHGRTLSVYQDGRVVLRDVR